MDLKASADPDPDPLRVKRKTLEALLLQCQRALELINAASPSSSASSEVEEEDCVADSEAEAIASTDPLADQVVRLSLLGFWFVRNFYFSYLPIWHGISISLFCCWQHSWQKIVLSNLHVFTNTVLVIQALYHCGFSSLCCVVLLGTLIWSWMLW